MDQKIAEQIFLHYGLRKVSSFQKIDIGWTNKVFSVNGDFILKVCEDESNEEKFALEVFFYNFFKNKIPIPEIRVYDDSKKIYGKFFMIYPKIPGDNLYAKWHLLNDHERKTIIARLCEILKIISGSPYGEFVKKFNFDYPVNWCGKIIGRINKPLSEIERRRLLHSPEGLCSAVANEWYFA